MKFAATLIIAVATLFLGTAEESQAQFYRGGSGFSISVGNGGFGGFGPGFGGFGPGFYGARPIGGFGGFGVPVGFGRPGVSFGYSNFRPVYGRSFATPIYGGRGGCRGW
jgi:hypothetical protein